MASFLRRQDDLQNLKVRNLYLQNTNGTYPADQSILTISGNRGYVVTSNSITVQNLTTCGISAANGKFTVNCPTGNTDISANLQVNGYMNQGNINIGTNYINTDGNGNPNIQIDAKEGGNGQAYLDLITQKTSTTTGGILHRVRSIIGNTGAYTLFHQTGLPGLTVYQEMAWDAAGTQIAFKPGNSQPITYIQGVGTKSRSFVTSQTAGVISVGTPGPTILDTINGITEFPSGVTVTRRYNVVFYDAGTYVWPTYVDVSCFVTGSTFYAQISNAGILPVGWSFGLTTLSPNATLTITTAALGTPPTNAKLNYITFGGQ